MKNDIEALREHLFATLDGLRNKAEPMDIARAKAVSDVAQTIINSARLEIDFIDKVGGTRGTGFVPANLPPSANPNLRTIEGGKS